MIDPVDHYYSSIIDNNVFVMKTSDLIGDVAEIDTPVPSALAVLRNLYKLKDDATSTTPT